MLIAELRKKLPDFENVDTREDVLTADVFGVLKYLPRTPYLRAVFEAVLDKNPSANEFREHLPTLLKSLNAMRFRFWPTHPTPMGISEGRTEPDVELSTDSTFILIEAKAPQWLRGKAGRAGASNRC